jgi:hypothetical protein
MTYTASAPPIRYTWVPRILVVVEEEEEEQRRNGEERERVRRRWGELRNMLLKGSRVFRRHFFFPAISAFFFELSSIFLLS